MTAVPGPFYTPKQRLPMLSIALLLLLTVLAVSSASGWPAPGLSAAAVAAILIILPALAPMEVLLGPLLQAGVIAICGALAISIPLLLDGSRQLDAGTLLMLAFALQGTALGLLQGGSPRPFCPLPGSIGRLALPWWVGAGVSSVALGAVLVSLGVSAAVYSLLALAAGLLLGLLLHTAGLAAEPEADQNHAVARLEESLSEVQQLLDQHRLPAAQRAIEAVHRVAATDPRVGQLRYAVWKFEPKKPQFHAAAGRLLAREEAKGGTRDVTIALYKDYLAVSQGQPALNTDLHLGLAHRFADWEVTDHAANIVNVYVQREPRNRQLPRTMLALAEAYARSNNNSRAAYFAETLLTLMPTTSEAHLAQRLLRKVQPAARS